MQEKAVLGCRDPPSRSLPGCSVASANGYGAMDHGRSVEAYAIAAPSRFAGNLGRKPYNAGASRGVGAREVKDSFGEGL
jgi:hypothetical protein